MKAFKPLILFMLFVLPAAGLAQDDGDNADAAEPVSGGVVYSPKPSLEGTLRDPFKSPFEIEQDRTKEASDTPLAIDTTDRLAFSISELELRGIYLQPTTGYWAIFKVGEDYKWWQVGIKFQDGDLVNITDGAVVFKHFISDDATQVREVVKELHRGEE